MSDNNVTVTSDEFDEIVENILGPAAEHYSRPEGAKACAERLFIKNETESDRANKICKVLRDLDEHGIVRFEDE